MSRWSGLVVGAVLLAQTAAAQQPGDPDAQRNVRQSDQYESLLCTNPAFRARRIAQECGSIDDPELKQSCVSSFDCVKRPPPDYRKAPPSQTIR